MVKRIPEETVARPATDRYNGGIQLVDTLDKGFPYDDGDNSIDSQAPIWTKKAPKGSSLVGRLNGENITKEALKNLVRDTDSPVTQALI